MTFKASWGFTNETAVVLETKLGWDFSSTLVTTTAMYSADAYTYAAYPGTHYSMGQDRLAWWNPPGAFQPGADQSGCWTFAMKQVNVGTGTVVDHADGGYYNRVTLNTATSFSLYVRSVFQQSSAAVDPTQWHYYCFKSDMESNPYKAEFWMDGIKILDGTEVEAAPRTNSSIRFTSTGQQTAAPDTGTLWGGISYWDAYTDAAQTPAYFSTGAPNEDLSELPAATWVATGGDANNFSQVSGVFDEAKYTRLASPVDGNNVVLGIKNGGTDDIGDQLGIATGTILGLSVHLWAKGEALNAHAAVSDGTNTTLGASTLVAVADPTFLPLGTAVSPSGPAWVLTDQPQIIFEAD